MPIEKDNENNVYVRYSIPEDIKSKIPQEFYFAFAGELVSVFGYDSAKWMLFDKRNKSNDLDSGTSGWYAAFYMTCKKLDMMWLVNYHRTLEWYDSDIFDGEIEAEILKVYKSDVSHANPYYKYINQLIDADKKEALK